MRRIVILHVLGGVIGFIGIVIGAFQAIDYFVNDDPINYWSFCPLLCIAGILYAALIYTFFNKTNL